MPQKGEAKEDRSKCFCFGHFLVIFCRFFLTSLVTFLPIPFCLGHTPTGSYSRKGVLLPSRCLLESPFLEPLLRTLLRTLLPIKTHCKTRHLLRTLLRTFSKAVLLRTLLRTLLRRVRCCTPPLVCALLPPLCHGRVTPADPLGEFIFLCDSVQILGGEQLLENCRYGKRGA